ncbi:hypothetical protein [Streptomyces sp. NPDC059994]|uniref:hypothetical protein n=1 Tax=Streptomyces sp. NPDC059994 TaxID=3347029 RepID=UPI003682ED5A
MSALPVVAVLGSAPGAYLAANGLTSAGIATHLWGLPAAYPAHDADALAALAAAVPGWSAQLSPCHVVVSIFDHPDVLEAVLSAHILPALRPGTLWIQMGPLPQEQAGALTEIAHQLGVACAHAPLRWSRDGASAYGPLPAVTGPACGTHQADADLVYGTVVAALVSAGLVDAAREVDGETGGGWLRQAEMRGPGALWASGGSPRAWPSLDAQALSEEAIADLLRLGVVGPGAAPPPGRYPH